MTLPSEEATRLILREPCLNTEGRHSAPALGPLRGLLCRPLSSHVCHPAVRIWGISVYEIHKALLDLRRHRTALSVTDRDPIDAPDRRHLGSGANKENFVGHIQQLARNLLFAHRNLQVAQE